MAGGLHPKVTGSALAGAFVGLLVAEAQRRGVTLDANESADLVVVVSFIVGYFVPNGSNGDTPSNGGNQGNVNGGVSTVPAATATPSAIATAPPSTVVAAPPSGPIVPPGTAS